MAADSSFDVVSKVDIQEVKNAIDQASKEVNARFDLKNSKSAITLEGDETVQLASQDEYTIKAVTDILQQKFVKRGVSLKNLDYEKIGARRKLFRPPEDQAQAGRELRCREENRRRHQGRQGEGERLHPGRHRPRVSSKDRDTLQSVIAPCSTATETLASIFSSPTIASDAVSESYGRVRSRPRKALSSFRPPLLRPRWPAEIPGLDTRQYDRGVVGPEKSKQHDV